jgi:hypothetical protein
VDAEGMAYLRSFYGINTQQEQEMLDHIWSRIVDAAPLVPYSLPQKREREGVRVMQNQPALVISQARHKRSTTLMQRLGVLAAIIFLVALVGSLALIFSSIRLNAGGPASGGPQTPPIITTVHPTAKPTAKAVPFKVTSVQMSVTPGSIAGIACGTDVTVTYKATIHVAANGPGGTVKFTYTVDNGRSQTPAQVKFTAGQTSKTYAFTWSWALPADNTEPGLGGIQISSPNQLTSTTVKPGGTCVSEAAFAVTSVDMTVSPASIAGLTCGTSIVVTYTATIHVAANGPGGIVQFTYTVDGGRGQNPAQVTFAAGQTSQTYSFTWSGTLPADNTEPGLGGIQISSPNQLTSTTLKPSGTCQ